MKTGFMLFKDHIEIVQSLSDKDAGLLFKYIYEYATYQTMPKKENALYPLFLAFKLSIDRNDKQYEEMVEKRRKAGRKGGLAKQSNANQKQAKATLKQKQKLKYIEGDE